MGKYIRKADRDKIPGGPLARHGGYSVAHKDELLRRHPEIQLYLKVVRRGLIRDLSPEGEAHLTTARHLLLDRLMQKLATVRLVETYLSEHGILRRDKLEQKVLDAEPITTVWLALNNQIRADIQLLGIERKSLEAVVLTPAELLLEAAKDEEGAEDEARRIEDGPGGESVGQTEASEGQGGEGRK